MAVFVASMFAVMCMMHICCWRANYWSHHMHTVVLHTGNEAKRQARLERGETVKQRRVEEVGKSRLEDPTLLKKLETAIGKCESCGDRRLPLFRGVGAKHFGVNHCMRLVGGKRCSTKVVCLDESQYLEYFEPRPVCPPPD
jgi:hypothetical protein